MSTTTPFADLYRLLDVPPDADEATISGALRKKRREWRTRQAAANPQRRAEAEEVVRQLDTVEQTLLDAAARERHDRERERASDAPQPQVASTAGTDWKARARQYLELGDADSANLAAREATTRDPRDADAWALRGQASLRLNDHRDAIFSLREATQLRPDDPFVVADLGDVQLNAGDLDGALASYRRCQELAPDEPLYRAGEAAVHLSRETYADADAAVTILERAEEDSGPTHPSHDRLTYLLAVALAEKAFHSMTPVRDSDGDEARVVTSQAQAEAVRSLTDRALALPVDDAELREEVSSRKKLADQAFRWHWRLFGWGVLFAIANWLMTTFKDADDRSWGAYIMTVLWYAVPAAVLYFGGQTALAILYVAAIGSLGVRRGWTINRRLFKQEVTGPGGVA